MFLFSHLLTAYADCPINTVYPAEDWSDNTSKTSEERASEIEGLEKYMFTLEGKDRDRKGIRTNGIVLIQHGEIIYEKYGRGFGKENPHLL